MGKIIQSGGIDVPIGSHEGRTMVIGSDHRGFEYKRRIAAWLHVSGYSVIDVGTGTTERCDYPAISDEIGRQISYDPLGRAGIGICGSGIGILIPASRHRRVYAARCATPEEAVTSRKHNNTNLLGIGADSVNLETALGIIGAWLETPFYSDPATEGDYLRRYVQTVKLEAAAGSS